jgi:hypothetical protein
MKKKPKTAILSLFLFLIVSSILFVSNSTSAYAVSDDEKINIDNGDHVEKQIRANERIRFRFRERTKITVECNERINCSIDCEAKEIGDKDFEIEVDSDDKLNLTMKCREERHALGLRNGNTVEVRNRYRHRYQEGFVVDIDSSEDDIDAKLRIEETDENRGGTWAYYDKKNEEWVPVETTSKNGYLECQTDHFSTWTILVPEIDYNLLIIGAAGIGIIVLIGIAILLIKRRN